MGVLRIHAVYSIYRSLVVAMSSWHGQQAGMLSSCQTGVWRCDAGEAGDVSTEGAQKAGFGSKK